MKSIDDYKNAILAAGDNPLAIQGVLYDIMESYDNGQYVLSNPGNPIAWVLEAIAMVGTAEATRAEILHNRNHPGLAKRREDLYLHMTDLDFDGVFATPAVTTMMMYISYDELVSRAVTVNPGVKRISFPKHTKIVANNTEWLLEHRVDISIFSNGSVKANIVLERHNKTDRLKTNRIVWKKVKMPKDDSVLSGALMLYLELPMRQMSYVQSTHALSESSGFDNQFRFTDKFYKIRVDHLNEQDEWVPMNVTFSADYSPDVLTAVVQLNDNGCNVKIPWIYFYRKLATRSIRVTIYSTRGRLTVDMNNNDPDVYELNLGSKDITNEALPYVNAMRTVNNYLIFNDAKVDGGSDGLSFQELKKAVIERNNASVVTPITPTQLTNYVKSAGYLVTTMEDSLLKRSFIASRPLTKPNYQRATSSISALPAHFKFNTDDLIIDDYFIKLDDRILLIEGSLFTYSNNLLTPINPHDLEQHLSLHGDEVASRLNTIYPRELVASYVLHTSKVPSIDAYILKKPSIKNLHFINDNAELGVSATTVESNIVWTPDGYRILFFTSMESSIDEVSEDNLVLQVRVTDKNTGLAHYKKANYLGSPDSGAFAGLMVYEVLLDSNAVPDINKQFTVNGLGIGNTTRPIYLDLEFDLDIFYILVNASGLLPEDSDITLTKSNLDSEIDEFLLPNDNYAMVHESCQVALAKHLPYLWSNVKAHTSELRYRTYEYDVPDYYTDHVLEEDEDGLPKVYIDEVTNTAEYVIKYRKGDIKLDENGEVRYKHRVGDLVRDHNGNKIPINSNRLEYLVDLLVLDGRYRLSENDEELSYLDSIIDEIASHASSNIKPLADKMIGNHRLYYLPMKSSGQTYFHGCGNLHRRLDNEQSIYIEIFISRSTRQDTIKYDNLVNLVRRAVVASIERQSVNSYRLARTIREISPDDIYDASVSGLGGDLQLSEVTLNNNLETMSLAQKLIEIGHGEWQVVDDLTIVPRIVCD